MQLGWAWHAACVSLQLVAAAPEKARCGDRSVETTAARGWIERGRAWLGAGQLRGAAGPVYCGARPGCAGAGKQGLLLV